LEHWLLRYSQNRRGGGVVVVVAVVVIEYSRRPVAKVPPQPIAIISHPAMQNQLSFLMAFENGRLHLRELPPFVRFLIEALAIEVFTEPSPKHRPSPSRSFHTQRCKTN